MQKKKRNKFGSANNNYNNNDNISKRGNITIK